MNEERFALLVERYLAGALSEAEARELADALESDESARARFLSQVRLSVALSGHLSGHAQEDAQTLSSQVLHAASASGRLKSINRIGKRLGLPFAEGATAHQGQGTQAENLSSGEGSAEEPDIKFATGIQKFVKERKSSKRIRKGSARRARIESRVASRRRAASWPWLPVLAAACALVGVTLYLTVFRRDSGQVARSPESIGQVVWVRELTRDEFAPVLVRTVDGEIKERELEENEGLLPGDRLKTKGPASSVSIARAAIRMRDGAEVDLADATQIRVVNASELELESGRIYVETPGNLRINSELADVDIEEGGAALDLMADEEAAHLRVDRGWARVRNRHGQTRLGGLQESIALKGTAPSGPIATSRDAVWRGRAEEKLGRTVFLEEDFDDAASHAANWAPIPGAAFSHATDHGRLEIFVGGSGSAWKTPGGLRTKQSFKVPLVVSTDVEVPVEDDRLLVVVSLIPASGKDLPGERTFSQPNAMHVRLRGNQYACEVRNVQKSKDALQGGTWPRRERWRIRVDRKELVFEANHVEICRAEHGLSIKEGYRIGLEATAKNRASVETTVSFDRVRIETALNE